MKTSCQEWSVASKPGQVMAVAAALADVMPVQLLHLDTSCEVSFAVCDNMTVLPRINQTVLYHAMLHAYMLC